MAVRTPPIATVSSATPHRAPGAPRAIKRARGRQQERHERSGRGDETRATGGGRGVEPPQAAGALARDHATQQGGRGHVLDVRQGVTSRHEPSLVAGDDSVEVEPPRRRRIAYYIAHA